MCAPCGAKNATLSLSMMLFAMLNCLVSCTHFFVFIFNMFMFNSVKQCKSLN